MSKNAIAWTREGDCIRCTSHGLTVYGYARLKRNGEQLRIARMILVRRHGGYLPKDIASRHTCDNRWCINPAHIIEGTFEDNNRDKVERNRGFRPIGGKNGSAKLTESDVRIIRESKEPYPILSSRFGVAKATICRAKNRASWSYIV